MVKNLPCNVGEVGLIPGWETKKDPTCLRATKPMYHNWRPCVLPLLSPHAQGPMSRN